MDLDKTTVFRSLDREAEIKITGRNRPHWFQAGAATFVTFRTVDSIPKSVFSRWRRELVDWLRIRNLPCDLSNQMFRSTQTDHDCLLVQLGPERYRQFKRLSDQIFHRSLDECHGECLLRDRRVAEIVRDSILHRNDEQYDLCNFVIMPNHVHVIVQFRNGSSLGIVSQSWMRYSARQINQLLGRRGNVWQAEPFDHIIRSPEQFAYLKNYIADNPKKAHISIKEYLYWES